MVVAFSVGRNSENLIKSINKHHDDIEFYTYGSVDELINESTLRHIFFDRIVFSESVLTRPERDLNTLSNYLVENSESTSVVLIVKDPHSEAAEVFNRVFKSPLYTAVVFKRVTLLMMCDVVRDDIINIRTKYYTPVIEQEGTDKKEDNSPQKSGRGFSFGFGRGKAQNQEPKNSQSNTSQDMKNVSNNNESGNGRIKELNSSSSTGFAINNVGNGNMGNMNSDENTQNTLGVRNGVGSENISAENSGISSEDDFLGLGAFGRDHSDTGFLDESELEIDDEAGNNSDTENQKRENPSNSPVDQKQNDEISNYPDEKDYSNNELLSLDFGAFSRVILVTGERGVGVTTAVVDMAFSLYENGESVLLVDADYKRNGLLSFIDSREFYDRGNEDGIDTVNPFVDEEADIVSNGYGASISKTAMMSLLQSNVVKDNYDRVIIDCPLDCLNCISERTVRGHSVLVLAKGDRVSLVSTSIGLTDRSILEAGLERYIMNNCIVAFSSKSDLFYDDIDFVKETVMFPNGCWLDNL